MSFSPPSPIFPLLPASPSSSFAPFPLPLPSPRRKVYGRAHPSAAPPFALRTDGDPAKIWRKSIGIYFLNISTPSSLTPWGSSKDWGGDEGGGDTEGRGSTPCDNFRVSCLFGKHLTLWLLCRRLPWFPYCHLRPGSCSWCITEAIFLSFSSLFTPFVSSPIHLSTANKGSRVDTNKNLYFSFP